ncbi:poly(glycerol-phosphate) alpha-glucosyltransferase [Algimonas arctica]|uniref:Poly(Glycerol-phosphate) alpha-glucosyltransferase n=1 Tax=Algimonas arctica TaxID=1479486 RepID=A0A8J3CLZ3_9PROT|nr:glycosyltransferase [Algimonas arctica]GHA85125.1 poly(glycerol-phosphate) alpha-glucosyltransferase [Algimonas arctica]
MRILKVTGSLSRQAGGLFTSVRRLSQSISELGHEVHVVGIDDADYETDQKNWGPLLPTALSPRSAMAAATFFGIKREIVNFQPDIIHQHGIWLPISHAVSQVAHPVIISPRGMLDQWAIANSKKKKKIAWALWEHRNLRNATYIHALADAEANSIRQVLPNANITTIPNGIDSVTDIPIKEITQNKTKRELLFLGRIHPKKGLQELLSIWPHLNSETRRNWTLIIAGPDENAHRQELASTAFSLGLNDDIVFVGPLYGDDKKAWLRRADAFVLPSKSEGLPMSVLEAWAYGLPVLMTKECNLSIGFKTRAALEMVYSAESVDAALNTPNLAAYGDRGRRLVKTHFSWLKIAKETVDIYERMLT